MDFKENVKYVLNARGMTQVDLANKLGVTKQSIQHYLNGNITLAVVMKMAIALDTTIDTLVSEAPLSTRDDAIPNRSIPTATTLVCPHCGKEIKIIAKT